MKVPEPRRLKSGTWFIQLRLGGQSVPVTASSRKACTRAAELIKAEYRAGNRPVARSQLTIRQAIDEHINEMQNELSPSTIRGYRTIQSCRFQKYMDTPIKEIKDWQAVYDSELDRLSPKSLWNGFALIKTAVEKTGTKIPKISKLQVTKKERPYLDYDQIQTLIEALKGKQCEIGALLALSSLRCSEILALTWDKVDLKNSRVLVAGAVVPDQDNVYVSKETNKTESSRRCVPIFIPRLLEALTEAKQADGPVVHYKTESGLLRAVNSVCEGAGLPLVGIHGLRHSFASLCVHLSIPEETAMRIGGWSDFQTMRKIYTHIAQRDQQDQVAALTAFFTQNANKNANQSAETQ